MAPGSMFGGKKEQRGIIPRCVETVFAEAAALRHQREVSIEVSFLEMYCDRIRDLGSYTASSLAHI